MGIAENPAQLGAPQFEILYRDKDMVAIEKPPGFHVHQPEDPRQRVSADLICLNNLRKQLGQYLFPIHRLDVGTDGVLLFALSKDAAKELNRQFQSPVVRKTYFAIVRGWADDEGSVDLPLGLDSTNEPVHALTHYRTHARCELNEAVGKRHGSARYSLVEVRLETGRFHQIRRHFARLAHPLIGDRVHGDSHHNRFFRERLEAPGLWLKAKRVEFLQPITQECLRIESQWSPRWFKTFNRLDMHPRIFEKEL